MDFLQGLHGIVAAILICCLLFVDEAGLPLPIAPNEALLLLTGVLVANGAFPLWIILPAAYLVMAAGMIAGYLWARTVGQAGLEALAKRLNATAVYDRARIRLQSASPWGIAVARMIPGIRPYATLISGAAEVDLRTFLLGALPALLVWELVWIVVGLAIGLPIAHFFSRVETVLIRGIILAGLGAVALFAVRGESPDRRGALGNLTPRIRAVLALLIDAGVVASVVAGLFAIGRRILHTSAGGWIEVLAAAILLLAVLVLARAIQTPGETLFDTNYWHHSPAASQ
ncbi:MAG TPA: VTT domain-containing protein [Chloroflexota bacterium]